MTTEELIRDTMNVFDVEDWDALPWAVRRAICGVWPDVDRIERQANDDGYASGMEDEQESTSDMVKEAIRYLQAADKELARDRANKGVARTEIDKAITAISSLRYY